MAMLIVELQRTLEQVAQQMQVKTYKRMLNKWNSCLKTNKWQ